MLHLLSHAKLLRYEEFPLPTPDAGLTGIANAGTGVVVVTESLGNKVGFLTMV